MSVTAPPLDAGGAALDAQIAVAQGITNSNANLLTLYQAQQLLAQLQVEAVDHYMVTGWLNAATILLTYQPPAWDKVSALLNTQIASMGALIAATPANSPVLSNYNQRLYQLQSQLVDRIMDVPGGTSAATILANMTGFQSFSFEYVYTSFGFDASWLDI